jgi:hypothetical protein
MADYVYVNIHNKDIIPFLRRRGPVYGMGMSVQLYNRLREIPGVEIYTIQQDEERKIAAQIKKVTEEVIAPKPQTTVRLEPKVVPVVQTVITKDETDLLIDAKLNQLPEDREDDIVLNETDFAEIAEKASIKKYEPSVLKEKTKAQLKQILNVERGFEPGHKYYGGYHDNHDVLMKYVLDSQK